MNCQEIIETSRRPELTRAFSVFATAFRLLGCTPVDVTVGQPFWERGASEVALAVRFQAAFHLYKPNLPVFTVFLAILYEIIEVSFN